MKEQNYIDNTFKLRMIDSITEIDMSIKTFAFSPNTFEQDVDIFDQTYKLAQQLHDKGERRKDVALAMIYQGLAMIVQDKNVEQCEFFVEFLKKEIDHFEELFPILYKSEKYFALKDK